MAANPHIVQRFAAIQKSLMANHQGGAGLPSAVKGSERETFLREFLRQVFPTHYRFTHGAITDASGQLSGQVDLAVEYPFLPSFPMPAAQERLLLAESVAAVIEIKSDLVSQWSEVEATVRKVNPLRRKWLGGTGQSGGALSIRAPSSTRIPCIAVGYRGHKTLDGLMNRLSNTSAEARPDAAYVIESGCYFSEHLHPIKGCKDEALALFSLCLAIWKLTSDVATAGIDLAEYAGV